MTNLWWLEQKQNSTGEISLPIQLYFVIINGSKLQEPNMQASIFHLTIVLTAKFLASVHGYPNGAPMSACSSFTPQHPGTSPSTAPFPYTITTDTASYEPGGKVTSKTAFFTVFFLYVFICLHSYVYIYIYTYVFPFIYQLTNLFIQLQLQFPFNGDIKDVYKINKEGIGRQVFNLWYPNITQKGFTNIIDMTFPLIHESLVSTDTPKNVIMRHLF